MAGSLWEQLVGAFLQEGATAPFENPVMAASIIQKNAAIDNLIWHGSFRDR